MKRVIFCPAHNDGCALFRMFMTHLLYRDSMFVLPPPGKGIPASLLQCADVALVQRQTTDVNVEASDIIKNCGLKYIYDLDDNIWHIPKYNNARDYFRRQLVGTEKCLMAADHITVSTTHLASIIHRKSKAKCPVTVIENAVDLCLFGRSRRKRNQGEVVIGWAGTNTHSLDLQFAASSIAAVMRKHDNVILEVMGSAFPIDERYKQDLGLERFRFRPWINVEHWPAWCSNLPWDIAIAPLLITSFNASKSSVKMIESGAAGIPCVASGTQEY